jgi:hypothetical protein
MLYRIFCLSCILITGLKSIVIETGYRFQRRWVYVERNEHVRIIKLCVCFYSLSVCKGEVICIISDS